MRLVVLTLLLLVATASATPVYLRGEGGDVVTVEHDAAGSLLDRGYKVMTAAEVDQWRDEQSAAWKRELKNERDNKSARDIALIVWTIVAGVIIAGAGLYFARKHLEGRRDDG